MPRLRTPLFLALFFLAGLISAPAQAQSFFGRVAIQLQQVDDLATVYLNGEVVLTRAWGEGEGGVDIGHLPGRSEVFDITESMRLGLNQLRFVVWNDALCCGVAGFLTVWVGDEVVYEGGIEEEDSTEGVKFDDTFTLLWGGEGLFRRTYYYLNIESSFGGGVLKVPDHPLYAENSPVTLRAITMRGFRFVGWGGEDAEGLSDPQAQEITVLMDRHKKFKAQFELGDDDFPDYEACQNDCETGDQSDADRDGLSACIEECMGSSDTDRDSDRDGIPDWFESRWGMDPGRFDAYEDPDGNGVINVREFLEGATRYEGFTVGKNYLVSPEGEDSPDGGGLLAPWRSISYALNQITPTREEIARITILSGEYVETLQLKSWVILSGALGASVRIRGQVTGADYSALENLRIEATGNEASLLTMPNARMKVAQVLFEGTTLRQTTALLITGAAPDASVIENCGFYSLAVALDIGGAIPKVRRCLFSDIREAAVLVRRSDQKTDPGKGLGDHLSPQSGWNYFSPDMEGYVLVNERDVTLKMENNDWGTDDPAEIEARIDGPVDYEPALATGSAILASSLFCTLWDEERLEPILNASVSVSPTSYEPVTENTNGVYGFPAIVEGAYTIVASAPGYTSQTQSTQIAAGDIVSALVYMQPLGEGETEGEAEGEGEGEGETPPGCTCCKTTPTLPEAGDLSVALLALATLLLGSRRFAPKL